MITDSVSDNKGETRRVAFSDVLASLAPQSPVMSELRPASLFLIAPPPPPCERLQVPSWLFPDKPQSLHCLHGFVTIFFFPASEAPPDCELSEQRDAAVQFTAGPEPSPVPGM